MQAQNTGYEAQCILKLQMEQEKALLEFQSKQKDFLNKFHNHQNAFINEILNIMYMYYLDAVLDKDDKTQQIYLLKVKLKKAETKIIYEFQKEQKLALIKIQNAEYQAHNMISQAINTALYIVIANQDGNFNIQNIWVQVQLMPNVLDAKNQARTSVISIVEQAQKNIKDAIEKLVPNYINKVIIINKTIKNLLRFQIKNSYKGFNLVEIQNYETLINDNNNIALEKIKIAMSIFLIEIENAKKHSTYNVNKAIEQTILKREQY
jgi:hypothetical protein